MKLQETPFMLKDLLGARVTARDFDPTQWQVGQEVVLRLRQDELLLRQNDQVTALALTSESGSMDFHAQNLDALWLLVRVKPGMVWLQCLVPMQTCQCEPGLDFGADQRTADSLHQQQLIGQPDIAEAMRWLMEEFVCTTEDGSSSRVFMAIHARQDQRQMQLVGRRYVVDLKRDAEQALWVERIAKRRRESDEPFALLNGHNRFVDASQGMQAQTGAQRAILDAAVNSFGTYLELWHLYGQKEWDKDVQRASELKALRYSACQPASEEGGGWRLSVQRDELKEFSQRWRTLAGDDDQLEIDEDAPDWSSEHYTDLSVRDKRRLFRGKPQWRAEHLILEGESGTRPPQAGYVYLSLAGNRTQQERRQHARRAIEAGLGVPALRNLLQDLPTPTQRPSRLPGLTVYARQSFKSGRATDKQEEAIRVALNTPDVALIIGPPGTGKTQVIAALERRLAELNEGQVIAQEVLISSFQHDAVENALDRTDVYGLPAVKVGRSSRQEGVDPVQAWCHKHEVILDKRLDELSSQEPTQALLQQLGKLLNSLLILGTPSSRREESFLALEGLLARLATEARIRPSSRWQTDWEAYREHAADQPTSGHDLMPGRRRQLTRLVRGLRTLASSFEDDGPQRARIALGLLQEVPGLLTQQDKALLQRASSLNAVEPTLLAELAVLRDQLLDRLRPDSRSATVRSQFDASTLALLQRLHTELADKVAATRHHQYGVLERYRDAFRSHPGWVRKAIENYSSIVGATCQQSASRQMSELKNTAGDSMAGMQFTSVVIDEAARANPLDLFIPMALAKRRIVLVGDHRQLPHLLDTDIEEDIRAERGDQVHSNTYKDSLFERLWRQFKQREAADGFSRVVMLDTQFRMHPRLGDFVSQQFYENAGLGKVHSGRKAEDFIAEVPGFGGAVCAWRDVSAEAGREESHGTSRRRRPEAKQVAREVQRLLTVLQQDMSVGVITFYAAQRDCIFEELAGLGISEKGEGGWRVRPEHAANVQCAERLRIGTVDAFQGKEFDVVVLSVVRSNPLPLGLREEADSEEAYEKPASRKYGHLRTSNRLNVAMSRQRRLLVAVGDQAMFSGKAACQAVPEMNAFLELCQQEAQHVSA
ncbi:DEAD/DEAH box helicase [Polaromonas naphthalenivorans]|uniref:Superfamily I DNA and RNA helicases and helicase subunits-like protein n=1 Tax=Polaromonas naphthalenivorans (strain CJ2) TaxID=365044 RepID=A1VV63_POLNA|nr:AAA domain-containing protein [Polaromonas naphthalenivorans]ABM39541.1 Superfamily I DNA and RNA helicases and helicase subunits-like protein [Polaromonas naphthalenivorans CJ2]